MANDKSERTKEDCATDMRVMRELIAEITLQIEGTIKAMQETNARMASMIEAQSKRASALLTDQLNRQSYVDHLARLSAELAKFEAREAA